ncbi:unnamed protein product [Lampetra fluviatilis]
MHLLAPHRVRLRGGEQRGSRGVSAEGRKRRRRAADDLLTLSSSGGAEFALLRWGATRSPYDAYLTFLKVVVIFITPERKVVVVMIVKIRVMDENDINGVHSSHPELPPGTLREATLRAASSRANPPPGRTGSEDERSV